MAIQCRAPDDKYMRSGLLMEAVQRVPFMPSATDAITLLMWIDKLLTSKFREATFADLVRHRSMLKLNYDASWLPKPAIGLLLIKASPLIESKFRRRFLCFSLSEVWWSKLRPQTDIISAYTPKYCCRNRKWWLQVLPIWIESLLRWIFCFYNLFSSYIQWHDMVILADLRRR